MKNIAFLVCAVMSSTTLAGPLRFDMGPADAPVEKGYEAVTNTTIYNKETGWGWLRACENVFDSTHAMYPRFGTNYTRAMVTEPATDLTIDGVNSSQDMVFQADLPNGKYWILARVGDLGKATFKTAISVNGELRDNKIDAFTFRDRGTLDNPGIAGGVNRVRLVAEVTDGRLEIRFHRARTAGIHTPR